MRYIFYVLTSLTLLLAGSGCCLKWNYYGVGDWEQKIDGPEITHAIQHYIAYLKHVKRLRLEDSAVYYNDTIHTVRMEFSSQDIMEICDARELLVDVVEGLLYELNKNPVLAPQFIDYPLSSANLEIYIRFESFEQLVDPYYVGWVRLEFDTVTFYAFNVEGYYATAYHTGSADLWDYRVEPYFKSREFVLYGRESGQLFKMAFDQDYPSCLKKEQYCPPVKVKPRYYSPYTNIHSFDNPL